MLSRGRTSAGAEGDCERGVRQKAGPAIESRVVALEQQHLVRAHVGRVEPTVALPMGDAIIFAGAVRIDDVSRNEVVWAHAGGIANGERVVAQRPADCSPNIDDGEATAHQLL